MATCWIVLSGGGQHRVFNEYDTVVSKVEDALEQAPTKALEIDGMDGAVFPAHVIAVRPGDA